MFSSWGAKKEEAPKVARDDDALVQQLIDKLRADGGDKAGEQLVAGEREREREAPHRGRGAEPRGWRSLAQRAARCHWLRPIAQRRADVMLGPHANAPLAHGH